MKFEYMSIPPYMMRCITEYVEDHIPPSGFLRAVLQNDLTEACSRADSVNIRILGAYVAYLYNEVPAICWGSPAKVAAWLERGRSAKEES